MGCIIAAEVYIEDNSTNAGLLIPYKAIQFDNPIVTRAVEQGDQNLYDAFVGMLCACYKVIRDKNRKIKQVLLNDPWEYEVASFDVSGKSMGSIALKRVTVRYISRADKHITYTVIETDIPDEIEEVLHFGGKGWLLENKG